MRRLNYSHQENLAFMQEIETPFSVMRVSNSNLRETSPVDEFYCAEQECSDLDKPIKVYRDPLYELFNQTRLAKLGTTALDAWIKSMMVTKDNPLSELREKCSDSELLSIMKSRYCQSPSEVMNWARYLKNNLQEFEKEVSLARKQQEELALANKQESANVVAADGAATPQAN